MDVVVESYDLCCMYFDVFCFFIFDVVLCNCMMFIWEEQLLFEQFGCLYVGMDLYKWVMKFGFLIFGELLFDMFELVCDIWLFDMWVVLYDLLVWEIMFVFIEIVEGKVEYV